MDVQGKPLIAQNNNIRVDPFAQAPSASPAPTPGVAASTGPQSGNLPVQPGNPADTNQDGELDADEVNALQQAAAGGDKEASDLLKNLALLAGGVAAGGAALYGATRGGLALTDALAKRSGVNMRPTSGGTTVDPREAAMKGNGRYLTGPDKQLALPAPQPKITDQTGSRFNQPNQSTQQKLLPDLNRVGRETDAAYAQRDAELASAARRADLEKSLGQSVGMRLRAAASAVRKLH